MLELVESLEEVKANIREYQRAAAQTPKVVFPSQVRQWYQVPDLELVGACRFIGYTNMTAHGYQAHKRRGEILDHKRHVDGRKAKEHLDQKGWFEELLPDSPEHERVYNLAAALCAPGTVWRGAKFNAVRSSWR